MFNISGKDELQILILNLRDHINHTGGILIRQLRRKDYLVSKRDKQCDIITAHLQAHSPKRSEYIFNTFSLTLRYLPRQYPLTNPNFELNKYTSEVTYDILVSSNVDLKLRISKN